MGASSSPIKCALPSFADFNFIFVNCFEFSAFYFIYVLSMYVTLALIIGPNVDGELGDF